jgi:hypothetical protein
MTKRNFTDLTAIDCPFGELDDDTQARLKAWPHGWEHRFLGEDEWISYKPVWSGDVIYRARRASDAKPECLHPFCGLQCGDAKPEPAGPVITETVKRIVPGVYGAVTTSERNDSGVRISFPAARLDATELRAAIATLTEIADALEGGAK